jgi:hypothetical protein
MSSVTSIAEAPEAEQMEVLKRGLRSRVMDGGMHVRMAEKERRSSINPLRKKGFSEL